MGSSSKKGKEKESRKRRFEENPQDSPKEKRHKHKKHHHHHHKDHKDRKRDNKPTKYDDEKSSRQYESEDSDVVEIIDDPPTSSPPAPISPQDKAQENQSNHQDSLSIDETNKLRAKLGLKPLDQGHTSSKDDMKKDEWGEFYHKPAQNINEKTQQEKVRTKLQEMREKRRLSHKLSAVKTLGESDDEEDLTAWVDKSRKKAEEKLEAQKRERMLEELDAQLEENRVKTPKKYTEKDLKGLTIQHDLDSFDEEKTVILTLKDKAILDEDGDDVLVNVNMIDEEKYRKNIENKKKKAIYNPYEDEEFDDDGNYRGKSLLGKYDEEIGGEKRESFKIGYDNAQERKEASMRQIKAKLAKKRLESASESNLKLASDYYNEEEMAKFKKPKRKIKKIRTKGKLQDLNDSKQDDSGGSESRRPGNKIDIDIDDVPSVDIDMSDVKIEDEKDDLLERALHKARKIRQKENVLADIVKMEVKEEAEEDADGANIVLNSTAEFCRTLGDIPTYGKSGNRDENDENMDYQDERSKSDSDEDVEFIEETAGWNSVEANQGLTSSQIGHQEAQILDEEPDVGTGVGAALKLAMSKGYLDKEQDKRPSNSRLAHLQAKNYSIEDKSYGDEGGERQGGRRERYSGPITEFKEKDAFKPNVKLEYIDDDGHVLNSKEAFRYLSHKFHGKGPGKNKVEKRIQKSAQEQLMKKMSSTDTPLGTLNMLQAKQKETQSAYVVLSGNKQANSTSTLSKVRR
ncbi:unnamed protein product [Phyllotreta striolata]|uniref:U4/U6.U5 tri-snRNP-associated protein 1 n=1 Tax=Phyllotreta striolata TaxID=444603 RepID=A0A9N9XSM1_PHYSR|nr:unnamed protein product [Phyllotreta striolata]